MNDFNTQLSAMFDEVAAGINPTPNFEAVAAPVAVVSNGATGGSWLPRFLGVAAVSVALLGGGVAAFQFADGEPDSITTSSELIAEPVEPKPVERPAPKGDSADKVAIAPQFDDVAPDGEHQKPIVDPSGEIERTAKLGRFEIDGDVMSQEVHGVAEPGEAVTASSEPGLAVQVADDRGNWKLWLSLTEVAEGAEVPILVTFGRSAEVFELLAERPVTKVPDTTEPQPEPVPEPPEPEPEPKPEPTPPKPEPEPEPKPDPKPEQPKPAVEFAVHLGDSYNEVERIKQVFYGTAPAGSVVTAGSDWATAQATADSKGGWEMWLKMYDVPDGTVVHVTVTANTGGPVFEYDLVRDVPEPEPVAFSANLGAGYLDYTPMKQIFHGTATPGSVVIATTDYGSADAVADSKGKWEMKLKMYEVPGGAAVGVRVTNNASAEVYEFSLVRPAPEPEPEPIDFTAQAAFVECDSTPPYNEYWGTSTVGAKITISSAFGGKQVTSNSEGHWEARVEFPEAPLGETFMVTVISSKGEAVYTFPFKRVA